MSQQASEAVGSVENRRDPDETRRSEQPLLAWMFRQSSAGNKMLSSLASAGRFQQGLVQAHYTSQDDRRRVLILNAITRVATLTKKKLNQRNATQTIEAEVTDGPLYVIDQKGMVRRAALPIDTRIYAIGDIHGKINLLTQLIRKIKEDANIRPIRKVLTVFMGDYIDRGLESKSVIESIINENGIGEKITLLGNHEKLMLSSLEDVGSMKSWCAMGGIQTMFSYGVDVQDIMLRRGYEVAQVALIEAVPRHHLLWLRGLQSRYEYGDYFFCHAGVNPDRSLSDQDESDLLWIRHKFTNDKRIYPKIIVHGHSPVDHVDIRSNRINVDTGACYTENLSCVALEHDGIRLIQLT